ncbi:MAG: hypothetical protein WBW34_00285, partial [Nitrososphaeraceae archaeon]
DEGNRMHIVSWNISWNIESASKRLVVVLFAIVLLTIAIISQNVSINLAYAETGTGADIFKVIMSVFGVEESKGDVVALVTVNNQESKVKFFDASGSALIPMNASEGNGHILEYVATFPNATVNSGDEYKACVLTVKDMDLKCGTGHNSPANRPEFIDINLDDTTATDSEPLGMDGTSTSMEDE